MQRRTFLKLMAVQAPGLIVGIPALLNFLSGQKEERTKLPVGHAGQLVWDDTANKFFINDGTGWAPYQIE